MTIRKRKIVEGGYAMQEERLAAHLRDRPALL
jgi:hypothetical protein